MNFIYVFSKEDKESLEKRGFQLLKEHENGKIFVFLNKEPETFEDLGRPSVSVRRPSSMI